MRSIRKQAGCGYHLRAANDHPPQTANEARSRWSNYNHKDALLDCLLEEQFMLCCYSEIRADQLGLRYHVEHIQPKSLYPQGTFDYQNLAASALDSQNDLQAFKSRGEEVFAGHAKLGEYNPILFISCHQPDCARHFAYLSDGRVVAAQRLSSSERVRADYTIRTLNLNSPFLITERRRWWDELDQLLAQHLADNWSIEHLASVDLVPANGKLSRFFSLTRQFFGHVAEQVLQQHSPQLL